MSTPRPLSSARTARTSSISSPRPSIRPVLVTAPCAPRVLEDGVAARVAGLDPDLARQPRHGLEVVGEDVGLGRQHHVDQRGVALEVAGQDLEGHAGAGVLDPPDGLGPVAGAAVLEVVAVDAGDDGVLEVERRQGLGHPPRLVGVGRQRPAGGDVAEPARPGADVAQDHDGQRPPAPALADVGAAGALAHGVEALLVDQGLGLEEGRLGGQLDLDPLGVPASARRPAAGAARRACPLRDSTSLAT